MADPRPRIGVNTDFVPRTKTRGAYFRLEVGYVDLILSAGGLPILLPPVIPGQNNPLAEIEDYLATIDGALLTGGADLHPKRYGSSNHPSVELLPQRRAEHDQRLFEALKERQIPVLGIGLGMQQINVAFGGTLHVHLPQNLPRAMPHRDDPGEPHRHLVILEQGTWLEEIYGDAELPVNSDHHQAVDQVGEGFRIAARAPDGVIEAIEWMDQGWFCVGIQWHPEAETASALDLQLIHSFLHASTQQPDTISLAA